ncbi:hypothetical protein SAMN05421676_10321 [Salinibacillus kushneri]|uniref:Uncharacterized protein n=1 Tax=Salinibacillus kushneri TaxID=237682 RepID=A0A1I0C3T0_9BACI|nr:hypothetical protein [Salinibacillus kushneri]SET14081.1 hypothetical protein SAMN05421676_10321 [Salinibacillus kushneri]
MFKRILIYFKRRKRTAPLHEKFDKRADAKELEEEFDRKEYFY